MGATAATLSGAASMLRRSAMGVGTLVPLHFPMAVTPQTRAKTILALVWGEARREMLRTRLTTANTPTQMRDSFCKGKYKKILP